MDPDAAPSMLDEIILALQPDVDEAADAAVLELTAGDLIADGGGEIVDLANILGPSDAQGGIPAGTLTELVSVEGGTVAALPSTDTTEPGNHAGGASILYTILSLSGDDPAAN